MRFGSETQIALHTATCVVNTAANGRDELCTPAQLAALLDEQGFLGYRAGGSAELSDVRALRPTLGRLWRTSDAAVAAQLTNRLLRRAQALPQLLRHDGSDWHVHWTANGAPLAQRLAAQAAIGFFELIQAAELSRLKVCEAPDCAAVLLDFSRNRSRRFCDTGNCANRQHVAAYRARKLSGVSAIGS